MYHLFLQGMWLKDDKLLRRVTQFIPKPAIFVILGFLLCHIMNPILDSTHFEGPKLSKDMVTNFIIAPVILHHSYNLHQPQLLRHFSKIIAFGVVNYLLSTSITAFLI